MSASMDPGGTSVGSTAPRGQGKSVGAKAIDMGAVVMVSFAETVTDVLAALPIPTSASRMTIA